MNKAYPLSRPLLMSLLLAYTLVMVLHGSQLPVWMMVLAVMVMIWRINIVRTQWTPPKTRWMVLITVCGVGLLHQEYQQWLSVEPMVTLLLLALSLKLLEIRQRRDAILIVFLAYFTIACSFLFDQSVLHSLLSLVSVFITTTLLLQLHIQHQHLDTKGNDYSDKRALFAALLSKPSVLKPSLLLAGKMLLQSTVLAAAMMLILPRLNPLWSVPLHSDSALVGMSDSMSPGDIGELIQNNALAFRVTFEASDTSTDILTNTPTADALALLPQSQRYWRGLVLDQFDGRRWQKETRVDNFLDSAQGRPAGDFLQASNTGQRRHIDYDIIMEPTGQHWLYGIPVSVITRNERSLVYSSHYEMFQKERVNQRIKYRARSYPQIPLGNTEQLSTREYRRYTALPDGSNPQTQQQALQWWQQSGGDESRYIQQVMAFFRENFTYTLTPPKLGVHTSDEFLFQSQQGFCEHYSSSFAVLMRSVGIPARVVVGYQGGQWDASNNYLSVYQRDAHAWNEVWLEGQGWVRFDPTAAVAAIRIEQGLMAALPQTERALVGNNTSSYQWIKTLQLQWQAVDYRWQQWVLSYDSETQQDFLKNWLGDLNPFKIVWIVLGVLALSAGVIALSTYRHTILRKSPEKKAYQGLQKKFSALGVSSQVGETVGQYCDRASQLLPHKQLLIEQLRRCWEDGLYNSESKHGQLDIRQFNQVLRQL